MFDKEKSCLIVFNGEIYNHKFLKKQLKSLGSTFYTKSDTEVILEAYKKWGEGFIKKLDGMFSIGIYDLKINKLLLFRDISGEKPLFFYHGAKNFSFSSELKSLIDLEKSSLNLDLDSLSIFLKMGYIPGNKSIFQEVKKLKSGHYLVYDLKKRSLEEKKYWTLPEYNPDSKNEDIHSKVLKLEGLLKSSVQQKLFADVPVGILLSGGVDSSLVVSMASEIGAKLNTFNVSFPNNPSFDESKYARQISDFFNTNHTEICSEEISEEILDKYTYHLDEPMADSSILPMQALSKEVSSFCKVALGGDGGDELFGGYNHYSRLLWIRNNLNLLPENLKNVISKSASAFLPLGIKGKNWLEAINFESSGELPNLQPLFGNKYQNLLFKNKELASKNFELNNFISNRIISNSDLIQSLTRTDFNNYLQEDILVKVDRASMMHSLEIRSPFLSKELIEFSFSEIESELKVSGMEKKILLKKLAKKNLPKDFNFNRKQGFSIPMNDWLKKKGKFRKVFEEVLLDESSIFDKKIVHKLFKSQDIGFNNKERLFSLFTFEKWKRRFNINI